MFEITKESLKLNRKISEEMEGTTFHLHTHLLYDIRTEFGEKKVKYLEIGAYSGGSVSLVSSHFYPTECFSLDLGYPVDPEIVQRNVQKFKNNQSTFEYIKGDSHSPSIINYIKDNIGEIDILFIDGDHSKRGVTDDYLNYSPLVKSGGYLVFDDYLDFKDSPDVKPVVDEIVKTLDPHKYEIIGSLNYDFILDFTHLPANNLFIIKVK